MTGEMVSYFAHRIQAVVSSVYNLNKGLRVGILGTYPLSQGHDVSMTGFLGHTAGRGVFSWQY